MSIVIPRSSTILGMIMTRRMESDHVAIKLPQNWNEDNDLLGFALFCVYSPMSRDDEYDNVFASESVDEESECGLTVSIKLCVSDSESEDDDLESEDDDLEWDPFNSLDFISVEPWCNLSDDDCLSDQMLVIYYPKDAIKEEFHSNQWTHFKALFSGSDLPHVEECGIHLIYANGFQCQQHEEYQRKLCLKGCEINELPVIEFPYELSSLCLRE